MNTVNHMDHLADAPNILSAIARAQCGELAEIPIGERFRLQELKDYQRFLLEKFAPVIQKPAFDYISKMPASWLVVGDRRREVASEISLIIERHGLGVGMLVLHLQQIHAGHILTRITLDGQEHNLALPTEFLVGAQHERVLSVPIRRFRKDFDRLASLDIAKPEKLWARTNIITHERDRYPCHYCSCSETNPAEVVVKLEGPRHGLSRHYSFGFTFAPFGNPLTVVHFLAWDCARQPLNMNRVPMTVSDLVKLTREINLSIRTFFADTPVRDYPVLDGVSNGWAGNTIYHQHFQFFAPEHGAPILQARGASQPPLVNREDVTVARMDWPTPVYRISAAEALNAGLVGNDLAGIWRLLGGSRKVPYKTFHDGYVPTEGEKVLAHTQNLYIPGADRGTTAYVLLRDRERVNFKPGTDAFVNRDAGFKAQPKENIGVIETTGTLIVDDRTSFDEMKRWQPQDISRQIQLMNEAVAPDATQTNRFETEVRGLFPP